MSDTDREKPLGGLAGSIDALFTALERSRLAARSERAGEASGPAEDPPGEGPVAIADLAPDEAPDDATSPRFDVASLDISALAPDEESVAVEDSATEAEPLDIGDLAPDEPPLEIGALAPDEGEMAVEEPVGEAEPLDIGDLAPDEAPLEIGAPAPDEEGGVVEGSDGHEEAFGFEGFETLEGAGAPFEIIPEVAIEDLAPDAEPGPDEETGDGTSDAEPWADSTEDALPSAVETYLTSGGARRDELSRRVRALAASLEEREELGPVSDAVERLIIAGRRHDQQPPVSLARLLASAGVIDVLARRLGGARDEERRAQLIEVAQALGARMAPAVGDALTGTEDRSARRAYIDALAAMGDGASDVVSGMIEDDRWYVVRNAVLILGEIGGRATMAHLTTALGHEDGRVRREAVLALARIGGVTARSLVPKHLEDPDPQVRAAAALAAGELKMERGHRLLEARLDDEKVESVQVALIRALGRFGDPASVPVLERHAVSGFFSRRPTGVRVAAYRALGAIGGARARKLLQDAVDDRDSEVRSAARAVLER
ncbi:MAG: HEAT repeat domain-containing protein [Gemmatimonadota bacterium]|jgi:HEAT repeat protein